MNVSTKRVDVPDGKGAIVRKRILVATKDFRAGDVIYKEQPVVAVLDADLEGQGVYCSHCLRHISKDMAIRPETDLLNSAYCSKECQVNAKNHSQNILFGSESPLPPELLSPGQTVEVPEERRIAQEEFVKYLKSSEKSSHLLVARFIARQVAEEIAKMTPKATDLGTSNENNEYSLYDHIERLRYLESEVPQEETKSLATLFQTVLPGLDQFITDERHATLTGKMLYNAYGVTFSGGRDDKPETTLKPEDVQMTRTPYGIRRQIGTGFYTVSSYIAHSCEPSTRPSFSNGTSELHLIANHDLKEGDEITVAYVDTTQHEDEDVTQARRRRRTELARGWRFACLCDRCVREDPGKSDAADNVSVQTDESKVEDAVKRMEERQATGTPSAGEGSQVD
ncbi:hypothetical protein EW146_g5225 [Bondarzewia mesenterica]|uniref:SET domain-containing protein n=1 Tax=Bondarzewia mesenterica TaxID=1095465 RepID=A0A4S4LS43_9AGAM|nr:hypothetical protein EW146_g5225 [Bondarzewia mesenterica]